MHGSGNHPDDSRSLGKQFGKLKDEVRATLKLLFKNIDHYPVDVDLSAGMTAYITELSCETNDVPLRGRAVAVSEDPIRILSERLPELHNLPLMPEAKLSEQMACSFEPVMAHEPVFDDMVLETAGVSFDNIALSQSRAWPLEAFVAHSVASPLETENLRTAANTLDAGTFKTGTHSLAETLPKIRALHSPRFYALPIRKSPVPPHRFSLSVREKFKQALAEKAQTPPANLQLKIVFERMDMTLFSSIQQDDHGYLLCVPKSEFLGKNQTLDPKGEQKKKPSGDAYLVYGFRLDNKESVRALVPASAISEDKPS